MCGLAYWKSLRRHSWFGHLRWWATASFVRLRNPHEPIDLVLWWTHLWSRFIFGRKCGENIEQLIEGWPHHHLHNTSTFFRGVPSLWPNVAACRRPCCGHGHAWYVLLLFIFQVCFLNYVFQIRSSPATLQVIRLQLSNELQPSRLLSSPSVNYTRRRRWL